MNTKVVIFLGMWAVVAVLLQTCAADIAPVEYVWGRG